VGVGVAEMVEMVVKERMLELTGRGG